MTDAELNALIADLRHGTLDVETGEKMDAGEWAHIAIEEVDTSIRAITHLRAQLAQRDAIGAVVTDAMVKAAHWVLLEETLSDEIIRSALTAALAQMEGRT